MKRPYNKRDTYYEIELKIKSLDSIRKARIFASERLSKYDEIWEFYFLIMNFSAVSMMIHSLVAQELSQKSILISSLFTIYVLLLQNYISKKNFSERALRFHYLQLEIEKCIVLLKNILIDRFEGSAAIEEDRKKYNHVMNMYSADLSGYENHTNVDFYNGNKDRVTSRIQLYDVSFDHILIWMQPFIYFLSIYFYLN